ncbi:DUF6882 domain-containing protein [Thalassotalea ganghwensis]
MFGLFKKDKFDIEGFIEGSMEALRMVTDAHTKTWNLGSEDTWNVDQDTGTIIFNFSDGSIASAPVQIVGSFNSQDQSFMWGWEHPSVAPELQQSALAVKAFAKEKKLKEFLTQKVTCDENRAWEYAALAMRISDANCAYRAEASPGTFVFMNFGEITLSKET